MLYFSTNFIYDPRSIYFKNISFKYLKVKCAFHLNCDAFYTYATFYANRLSMSRDMTLLTFNFSHTVTCQHFG